MKIVLKKRDLTGKKVKQMRESGVVPATIYGPHRQSMNLSVDPKEFHEAFKKSGYNNLVDVQIEGESDSTKALIKEVQIHPIREDLIHVSFYEVDMKKVITANIPVLITGVSPAVKTNIGFLVAPIDNLSVRCLPKDLPQNITISIDNLTKIGDSISVVDIKLPENVEFSADVLESTKLAMIVPPQKQIIQEEVVKPEEGVEEGAEATKEGAEGETSQEETKE